MAIERRPAAVAARGGVRVQAARRVLESARTVHEGTRHGFERRRSALLAIPRGPSDGRILTSRSFFAKLPWSQTQHPTVGALGRLGRAAGLGCSRVRPSHPAPARRARRGARPPILPSWPSRPLTQRRIESMTFSVLSTLRPPARATRPTAPPRPHPAVICSPAGIPGAAPLFSSGSPSVRAASATCSSRRTPW